MNRWHAWRSARGRSVSAFLSQPEPRTIGSFARGRQLVAGNFLFAGIRVSRMPEARSGAYRDQNAAFDEEVQGFGWLDDLAAVGDLTARQKSQAWLADWIALYGRGTGPGWTPDLTGRRLIRWINHAIFLLNGQDSAYSGAYYRSSGAADDLSVATLAQRNRWPAAVRGADGPDLCRHRAGGDGGSRRSCHEGAGRRMRQPDRRRRRHPDPQPRGIAGGLHASELGGVRLGRVWAYGNQRASGGD